MTITHRMSNTPEWRAWRAMRARCYSPTHQVYDRYGGRGIRVCKRWRNSFENFFEDMGARPSPTHSLDRIDNEKGYTPSNCRWATEVNQQRNRRDARMLTLDEETLNLSAWAERYGMSVALLRYRLQKQDLRTALETPVRPYADPET